MNLKDELYMQITKACEKVLKESKTYDEYIIDKLMEDEDYKDCKISFEKDNNKFIVVPSKTLEYLEISVKM